MIKSTSSVFVSILALSTALIYTPLTSHAKETALIDLEPQSPWAATMVEGAKPEDGYCVLARKYNKGMVLTLGQSARDEYSLALDFQGKKLNLDKSYKVNLQPAPGQLRAYEVLPASAQAIVVRLGYDESFLQALEGSSQLKADVDGENYKFKVTDLTKGKSDLKKCVASLKGDDAEGLASKFVAEKIKNEEMLNAPKPIQQIEKSVAKKAVAIPAPEKVATANIVSEKEEAQAIVTSEPVVIAANEVKPSAVKKPILMKRVESKTLKEEAAIVTPEPIIVAAKEAVVEQTTAKVELPEVKIETSKQAVRVSSMVDLADNMSERPKQVSAQNKKYGSQLVKNIPAPKVVENKKASAKTALVKDVPAKVAKAEIAPEPAPVAAPKVVAAKIPAPVVEKSKVAPKLKKTEIKTAQIDDVLKDETKFPKPFSSATAKPSKVEKIPRPPEDIVEKEVKEAPIFMPKKAEQEKQKAQEKQNKLIAQEQKLTQKQQDMVAKRSAENDLELEKVREALNELEKENRALYLEARQARGAIDTAVVATSNEALKKMRAYEKKLEAAQADNLKLSREIEEMRRIQEDVQVSAAGGNVTVEKSVHRYNEAEREIKRLGLLLEQQRMAHRNEKAELENMLFDPVVTDEAQRRKLADLEAKLATAEKRLQSESSKVKQVDVESQKKLQALEQELAAAKKKEEQLKLEEQKVKIEAQRIAAAETKLRAMEEKEKALKEKEQRLLLETQKVEEEKARAQEKERSLAEAQKRAQEQQRLEAQARERALAEAKRVAAAEAKLEEVRRKEQELAKAEQALQAQTRAMAVAEAKLAEAAKKEQEIKAAEKRLNEKARNIEAYSRERIASAPPMAVVSPSSTVSALAAVPKAIAPSARNIRSNAPVQNTVVQAPSFGQGNLKQLLDKSGISSVSAIRQQTANQFYWKAAGMTGKARIAPKDGSLTQFAHSYIATEKKNCRGDFASLPARVPGGKQGYELACVSGNGGKSSSVVFSQQGNNLMAIAHETTMDNMDAAIDARDKVAKNL